MSSPNGRILRLVVTIVSAFVSIAGDACAQNHQWSVDGARYEERLGWDCVTCGDVDGDGLRDLLVSARLNDGEPGKVFVHSSAAPNARLLEFKGDAPDDHFGNQVGDLGDVDGDGLGDYAISAPDRVVAGAPLGAIFVVSGTGAVLRTITSPNGTQLGLAMAVIGDVDGDGVRDLLYNDDFNHYTVVVESGASGATIRTHTSVRLDFGYALGSLGDVDADGVADYAICDHGASNGLLRVYSGQSGVLLFTNDGSPTWVRDGGDGDGDGRSDVLLCEFGSGIAELVSGATGLRLTKFTRNSELDFGRAGSAFGDYDGDGFGDVVLSRSSVPWDPLDPLTELCVFSGSTGKGLVEYDAGLDDVWALDGSADFDGDGAHDVVAGDPYVDRSFIALSGASGAFTVRTGDRFTAELGDSVAVIGDRDGDGWRDVVLLAPGGLDVASSEIGVVKVVSGLDGQELSRFTPGSSTNAGARRDLVAIGDHDGDGLDDYAVACPGPYPGGGPDSRVVELRSGADDSLLDTIVPPSGRAVSLAAAAETSGAPLLAIETYAPERLFVFDLVTKTVTTKLDDYCGSSEFACVGDVDQDGLVDWLVQEINGGNFGVYAGGSNPAYLWWRHDVRPWALASVRDLDADGFDDVVAGKPNAVASKFGRVTVLSGVDGTTLYELNDPQADSWFGSSVSSVGDLDRDGAGDFVVGAPLADLLLGALYLYSGRTGTLLYRFAGYAPNEFTWTQSFATSRRHEEPSLDADGIPDLVIGGAHIDSWAGRAQAFRLDDLWLQVDPPIAAPSASVTLSTRGGPTGNVAGLFAVDFGGTPLNFFLAFGTFDGAGSWALTGSAPTGLSGNTLTLRSYAIGHAGRVVDSQEMTLTFQ